MSRGSSCSPGRTVKEIEGRRLSNDVAIGGPMCSIPRTRAFDPQRSTSPFVPYRPWEGRSGGIGSKGNGAFCVIHGFECSTQYISKKPEGKVLKRFAMTVRTEKPRVTSLAL